MLTILSSQVDQAATAKLRAIKPRDMRARYHPSDLNGAVISAARAAMKHGAPVFVYSGNSYGAFCHRVTFKRRDALCPIGNTGSRIIEVSPDRTLTSHVTGRVAYKRTSAE